MNKQKIAELEKLHTKALLKLLKESRYWCPYGCEPNTCDDSEEKEYPTELIKEVLKTREHIPNKKEAKALRQAAAKKGR